MSEIGAFSTLEVVCLLSMFLLCVYIFVRDCNWWFKRNRDQCSSLQDRNKIVAFRGYIKDEPESWTCKFPNSNGYAQSPINIKTNSVMVIPRETRRPLMFSPQYFCSPKSITVFNDGYGVLLATCFDQDYPMVTGGPLKANYRFNLAQFKWGPNDMEGSEHTVDSNRRYAMELQLMHIKGEKMYENLDCAVKSRAVLFISYFFQVTPMENPYLTPVTEALQHVCSPNQSTMIEPFPLCWLFHPFKSKYYFYQGSITYPPCTEGADWIVQSEPMGISSEQIKRFRTLTAMDGKMVRNTRPVQKLNGRTIYYYE